MQEFLSRAEQLADMLKFARHRSPSTIAFSPLLLVSQTLRMAAEDPNNKPWLTAVRDWMRNACNEDAKRAKNGFSVDELVAAVPAPAGLTLEPSGESAFFSTEYRQMARVRGCHCHQDCGMICSLLGSVSLRSLAPALAPSAD